jgi:hypothetical protein
VSIRATAQLAYSAGPVSTGSTLCHLSDSTDAVRSVAGKKRSQRTPGTSPECLLKGAMIGLKLVQANDIRYNETKLLGLANSAGIDKRT